MINELIKKYKEQMEENFDDNNEYADLSKAFAYKEILKDLEELKPQTICGYPIEEVITILNALELERILDIKVTMKNLGILSEELQKDFQDTLNKSMSDMIKSLGVDIDE